MTTVPKGAALSRPASYCYLADRNRIATAKWIHKIS
jgi:hypothetical protein